MNKYLINQRSMNNRINQAFCVDDYGVETEIKPKKWYDVICESEQFYTIKNEWNELQNYLKSRFRLQKQNLPNE
jgi:hypothetical protein